MTDRNDLIRRLRGEYRIPITDGMGPAGGAEPDNPNEFVREFVTPPIQHEAAERIQHDTEKIGRLEALLQEVLDHQNASFYGPDGERNRRAQWRGIIRKIKRVLKESADAH